MMSEPPKAEEGDELCPICNKEKSKHKPEEMLICSRKIIDSQKHDDDKSL